MAKKRLHIVTNTHWDREHRSGFQETRYTLVELIDALIEIMENDPDFKHFVFDGQTLVIEDYLEVKPHMRDRLKALIESKRILIGPWASLPDHFSINPECIIRNLLRGDRVCREFGHKMNFGYSIFSFGQTAQIPQLYAGFGIEDIIFYKRYPTDIIKKSEFIWEAPDGSKALASRMGVLLRTNFIFCFTIPVILGGDAREPGWQVAFTDGTKLIHLVDNQYRSHHATELETDIRIRKENIRKGVEDTLEDLNDTVAESVFMAFDGIDFSQPVKEIPAALKEANKIMDGEVELIHSNPIDYFKELREEIDLSSLINYKGEMRAGPMNKLQCEVMSANIELKQKNHLAETTILQYAEPFSMFNKINGGIYPYDMMLLAWKYIFSVHSHDGIHAAGVSKMKTDNANRLDQAQEIAEGISRRAIQGLVSNINTDSFDDNDILITLFNPTKHLRSDTVNLKIDLPREEYATEFHLEDLQGKKIEIYEYDSNNVNMVSINAENRPKNVLCKRVDIDLLVKDVPALGYKTLKLKRVKGDGRFDGKKMPFANPVIPYKPIAKTPNILDNGLLKIEVNPNGTVNITDLETAFTANGLNIFTDTGSNGDLWIHREPLHNQIITSQGCNANITITKNSYLSGTIKIDITLNIPQSLTEDEKSRSPHTTPMKISTEITLTKDSKRADFKVAFENKCKEHKITVGFPTNLKTDHSRSRAPFQIRKQPIENMSNNKGKIGPEPQRHPMHDFIDISDGKNGIALFTKGLKEFETSYYDDQLAECQLTLLRAVSQSFAVHEEVFLTCEKELAQCLGNHQYEYSLLFHKGDYLTGDVIAQSQTYTSPIIAAQFGKGRQKGQLPAELSFIKSSNRHTIINCIKRAEDNDEMLLRITNPTENTINEKLEFYNKIKRASKANLNEQKAEELTLTDKNTLELKIPPYKIVTLSLDI